MAGQTWVCRWGLLAATMATAPLSAQSAAPPLATAQAPLVLRGVTVIDVREGKRLPDQAVVIVGRRIERIVPAKTARLPKRARVVDATGRYLIPGLWDMHVHPQGYADVAYPLFVANGVTGVRDAGSEVPLATLSRWKQEIAAGTRVGPRLVVSGPALDEYRPQTGPGGVADTGDSIVVRTGTWSHHIEISRAAARGVVDSLKSAGADVFKFYSMTGPFQLRLAAEARRVGMLFGGHSENVPGLEYSDSGATFLDHSPNLDPPVCSFDIYSFPASPPRDGPACAAAMARLRRNGTWIVNTMSLGEAHIQRITLPLARALYYKPDTVMGYSQFLTWAQSENKVPAGAKAGDALPPPPPFPTSTAAWFKLFEADSGGPARVEEWKRERQAVIDSWRQFGIKPPFLAGTDVEMGGFDFPLTPGFVSHEDLLGMALVYGFTPLEALQTATLNPALALRMIDSLGTVEAGKLADLVLLDADPLEDIAHTAAIQAVVANGRYYDRPALDRLLRAARRAANHAWADKP